MTDDAVFHSSIQVPKTTSLLPLTTRNYYIKSLGLSKNQQRVFLWVLALITKCCLE